MNLICAVRGPEPMTIVDKDKRLILIRKMDTNDHIRLLIAIDIAEIDRDGCQVATIPLDIEGSNIIHRLRGVPTHKFNDDSLTIEVDSNEVAGMVGAFVMSHIGIGL